MERPRARLADLPQVGILIYEPEATVRSVLRGILHGAGARLIMTASGPEQLHDPLIASKTGLMMVRLALGAELTTAVRHGRVAIRPDLPIVAFQAAPTLHDVYRGLKLGIDEFVALPFTGRAVMAKVATALETPKPMVATPDYVGPDNAAMLKALADAARRQGAPR